MEIVAIDTETLPILPGLATPPLAVLSYCEGNQAQLVSYKDAPEWMHRLLDRALAADPEDFYIVGHNVAYDTLVLGATDRTLLPKLFEAYNQGRFCDTMIAQQLIDIARGVGSEVGKSLASLAELYLDRQLDKNDSIRLGYGRLRDIPIFKWPEAAWDYAIGDARATRDVFVAQVDKATDGWLADLPNQTKYEFATALMSSWGIRTDGPRVAALRRRLELRQAELTPLLETIFRPNGTKNLTALREIIILQCPNPPLTDKGSIATSEAALAPLKHPTLDAYIEYIGNQKLLSTYLPVLEEGVNRPINSRFRLVNTGRRGATKNMQTPPRAPGVRECFVPRDGNVICSADYDTAEMRSFAQVLLDLFGDSPLAELYQRDPHADPHTKFAAETFLKVDYAEGLRLKKAKDPSLLEFRQLAKAYNFGLPGGLGVRKFVEFAAAQYGVEVTAQDAWKGKSEWIATWRARPYFEYIDYIANHVGEVVQPRSGRVRGGIGFCDAANQHFQGMTADGTYESLFLVQWACYAKPASPLYGCRVINSLHDEFLVEMPEDRAHEAAQELDRLMVEGMAKFVPDVPIVTSPALMRYWTKKAESVFDDAGRLQVWEP